MKKTCSYHCKVCAEPFEWEDRPGYGSPCLRCGDTDVYLYHFKVIVRYNPLERIWNVYRSLFRVLMV